MDFGSKEYFQAIADVAQRNTKGMDARVTVGLTVRVNGGRKHKGVEGKVTRHMRSKFSSALRYASGASLDLRIMMGRSGFVAWVEPCDGSAGFWVNANYLEVL